MRPVLHRLTLLSSDAIDSSGFVPLFVPLSGTRHTSDCSEMAAGHQELNRTIRSRPSVRPTLFAASRQRRCAAPFTPAYPRCRPAPPASSRCLSRWNYSDLDVSRPEGSTILYSRIRAAAERVCSPLEGGGVAAKMRLNGCIDRAISEAVKTIPQPVRLASGQNSLQASRSASAR